ncbi:alpha/beta fold hydrolase [Actinoplanes derwentensis]|uniref:Pimeloyl-ACP methyl ester carboxylesterase n=1 Tax=Actinoplanes derwentensis TaxID=113562 RepID=A0A1H1W811_9ACTN|nr:alpha/beta hydrolase [Actinoplanes derwentensis]GID84073.1 alpha/beta hydrolase [Actinoplanes derwentensis]SDS92810.1 Pimeloyl-ACP methyl ester carboxylesterase [Actinoplanes derwentensis]
MPVGEFRNDQARDRFFTVYNDLVERLWPSPSAESDVVTSFGTTRVHRLGVGEQTPFVLLPGAGGPSLMWHAYVGRLAISRPVIAIDPVGEPGPSVQTRAIDNGDEWSRWLDEVLTALDVGQAHLVGTSYGGWIALRHALRSPDAVASLTLLDPAGFGKVGPKFLAWVIACGLTSFAPRPIRHALARPLRNLALRDDEAMPLVKATFGFRRRHIPPTPITDAELERITAPTLTLVGGHSQLYNAREVAATVTARMPRAVAEIIPEASHDLVLWHPDELAARIIKFAADTPARP